MLTISNSKKKYNKYFRDCGLKEKVKVEVTQ
jgi:hypothetical protein